MQTKKRLAYLLPVLLLMPILGFSQIITSKKEAIKKGIYQKPSEIKSTTDKGTKTVGVTDAKQLVAKTVETPKSVAAVDTKPAVKTAKPLETPKVAAKPKKTVTVINEKEDPDLIVEPEDNYIASQMINNAMEFIGTRYHGGGTTTSGMDCSGMVTAVFNIFDLKLPRSSNEMAKVGEKVEKKNIKKGDLIFFKTNGRRVINHVGMVVESNDDEIKFIHSSTNSGVIVSSTKEPYYKKTFAQVNRVL